MLNKAYINLGTLCENANSVKKLLNNNTRFCAVVKADGYGHGAVKVANALYKKVDSFAVALTEEGIALRQGGIDKEILQLIPPFTEDLEQAVRYNLTLTADSAEKLAEINGEAERQGKIINVHLKINTGMNRMGIDDIKDLKHILDFSKRLKGVKISGAFSHFGTPENKKQLMLAQNKFLLANNLVKRYNSNAICHISASGGLLQGVQGDMVRIGILLYGYKPFESRMISVKPIMKILAPTLLDRRLLKGESALYGGKVAKEDYSLKLVRCGYADGFFREENEDIFSNRCMDVTQYIAEGKGKFFTVLDDAEKIARSHNTISYEILTSATKRAEKIYIN